MSAALVAAGAVLSVTAAPATAGVPLPACDRAGPCVVVQVLDGTSQVGPLHYLYADQITGQADVENASYPVGGGGTNAVVASGSSVGRVVSTAVPDLAAVTFAEVVWNDAYQRHLLSGAEVRPGGFPGGLTPAFYSTDPDPASPTYWNYVRPQRTTGEANGAPGPDQGASTTTAGGSFLVRVHLSGGILDVQVTATPVGGSDRRYTLSTDQSGPGLSFDWVLPGGARSDQATPDLTFADSDLAGTYPVSVGVERADGSFGWGTVSVRAGAAPAPSPSATATGSGGDGPADQGPTSNPGATLTADPNPAPSGPASPSSAPTASPQPSATADAPTGPAEPTGKPTREPSATPTPQSGGDPVTGVVLVADQAPVTGGARADAPRPSPAARPLGSAPLTVPAGVLAGLVGAGLLGLGAATESRALRRRTTRKVRAH